MAENQNESVQTPLVPITKENEITQDSTSEESDEEENAKIFRCTHEGKEYGPVIANTPDIAAFKMFTLISRNKK